MREQPLVFCPAQFTVVPPSALSDGPCGRLFQLLTLSRTLLPYETRWRLRRLLYDGVGRERALRTGALVVQPVDQHSLHGSRYLGAMGIVMHV